MNQTNQTNCLASENIMEAFNDFIEKENVMCLSVLRRGDCESTGHTCVGSHFQLRTDVSTLELLPSFSGAGALSKMIIK